MGSHSYGVKLDQDALHIVMLTEQVGGIFANAHAGSPLSQS